MRSPAGRIPAKAQTKIFQHWIKSNLKLESYRMDLFKNWFSKPAAVDPAVSTAIEAVVAGNDDIDEAMMRRYIQTKRLTLEEWQSPTGRAIIAATEPSVAAAVGTAVMRERGKALAAVGSDFPPPDPPKPTKTFQEVMKKY